MSKALASDWMMLARRLADLEGDFQTKNIAICLASAYRQGWSDSREEEVQNAPIAATLLRTILAEAERTGSWTVPADIQERMLAMKREGLL